MNRSNFFQISDISSSFIFLSLCSLLIRGSFYSALFNGLLYGVFFLILLLKFRKIEKIKTKEILILSIPFFLTLFGYLFSDDKPRALQFIFRSVPLLFIPFLYTKVNYKIIKKGYGFIEIYFSIFILLVLYSYIIIGYFLTAKGLGDYLYYSNFSRIIDIHPTYSGCIVNLALLFAIKNIELLKGYLHVFIIILFLILLIIIGSKTSIFIGLIISIYSIFKKRLGLWKQIIFFLVPIFLLILSKPILENRLSDKKLKSTEKIESLLLVKNLIKNDIHSRFMLWKSNFNSLNGFELIIGKGTASSDIDRLKEYHKNNLNYAVNNNYNAHNQFVEILYSYGIVGFILFLFHCFYLIKKIVLKKQWYFLLIYFTFLFYFLFESMLIRSYGIILYAFIITYIYININQSEKQPI